MSARLPLCLATVALALACGNESGTSGDGTKPTCSGGQVVKYDPNTGQPYCAAAPDGTISGGDIGDPSDGGPTDGSSSEGVSGDLGSGDSGSTGDGAGSGDSGSADTGPDVPAVSGDWWTDCPPKITNPAGALHGKACKTDQDCLYGQCLFGGPLAGYDKAIGYCTKNCGCGSGDTTNCYADDPKVGYFSCAKEKTKSAGNDRRDPAQLPNKVIQVCARNCKTDTDCTAWNPELPHCFKGISTKHLSVGPNGVCGREVK